MASKVKIKVGRVEINGRRVTPPKSFVARLEVLKSDLAASGITAEFDIAGVTSKLQPSAKGKYRQNKRCSVCKELLIPRRFHKRLVGTHGKWFRCICNSCWALDYRFDESGNPVAPDWD